MTKLRVATGVAVGLLSAGLLGPAVARACSTATSLSLGGALGGPPGSTVVVSGTSFDPQHAITIRLAPQGATNLGFTGPILATVPSDPSNVPVTIPLTTTPGAYWITATDNSGTVAYVDQPYFVTGSKPVQPPSLPGGSPANSGTSGPAPAPNAPAGSGTSAGAGSTATTGTGATAGRPATHAAASTGGRVASGAPANAASNPAPAAVTAAGGAPSLAGSGAPGAVAIAPNAGTVPSMLPFQGLGNPREGFRPATAGAAGLSPAGAAGGSSSPWVALGIGLAVLTGLAGAGTAVVGRRRRATASRLEG